MPTDDLLYPAETHPAIAGAFSDPTICRVGDRFYVAHSSFEYFPGAPIHVSRDLVSWTQIGNILSRREQFDRGDGAASGGIFGSTLRHRDGRFWFVTTNVSGPAPVQTIVTADDPAGPWSPPIFVDGAIGIDPDLAWDEDGPCYLTWCHLDFQHGAVRGTIRQAPLDPATGALLEEPYDIYTGGGLAFPEGPHLYRHDGRWYLVIAEGGTERGHSVSVARGPGPRGPFEPHPANPVFTHRSTSHPVQNTGHADLVQLLDGSWAAVYLGVRPAGVAPGFYTAGRETFLTGVDWVDGWPRFDAGLHAVAPPAGVDDDLTGRLDPAWVVPGGEPDSITRPAASGGVDLVTDPRGDAASLLCQRVRDLRWAASVDLDTSAGSARFVLRMDDRHWYGIEVRDDVAVAVARIGDLEQRLGSTGVGARTRLRIRAITPPGAGVLSANTGPDVVLLEVLGEDGEPIELARLDGRYLSSEVAGGFTGRVLGVGALDRVVRLTRFTYSATAD